MAITITRTSDSKVQHFRALLYGSSGTGKTTSIGTLPEDSTLVISCERNTLPLRDRNFALARVQTWKDFQDISKQLLAGSRDSDGSGIALDGLQVECIVLDSLTELSDLCKAHIVNVDRRAVRDTRQQAGKGAATGNTYDEMMTIEDWGLFGNRLKNALHFLMRLPCHVVVIAREQLKDDKREGTSARLPMVDGKLAFELPAYFDLVARARTQKLPGDEHASYWWQLDNDGLSVAKGIGGVTQDSEPPDWSALIAKVFNGNTSSTNGDTQPTD
jgi:hypothetical protein